MPVADEKLVEKLPFDVYAMMLILSFLLLGVSVWLVNDDLQTSWFAGQQGRACAESITKSNDKPELFKEDPVVSEIDLKDFKAITGEEAPPKHADLPAWMKAKRIDLTPGHDNTEGIPEDVLQKLKESYEFPLNTPDDPDKKKVEAPATEAPAPAPAAPAPAANP